MKNWLNKNYKILIILAFLVPIIIVAVVSISHVTVWYGISNPLTWAMYLSLGVEIAALSALAAISASMGRNVYFPFIIVTIIQFIGNIFFSYQYIDINSKIFKDWVDLVTPLLSAIGVEEGDMVGHRRFLAVFSGGLLPLISLSFLHMLVKFSEDARLKKHNVINDEEEKIENNLQNKVDEQLPNIVTASDVIGEVSKVRISDEDLKRLESILIKENNVNEIDNNDTKIDEKTYDFDNEEIDTTQTEEKDDVNLTENEINDVINNEQETEIIEEKMENVIEEKIQEDTITDKPNFEIIKTITNSDLEKKN